MKKILLSLLLLTATISFSQIKRVKTAKPIKIGAAGTVVCEKLNNTYIFTFQDINYTHIDEYKSFQFDDIDNAFDNFYDILMEGFKNLPEEDIELKLPNKIVTLKYMKTFGVTNLTIITSDDNGISGRSEFITKRRAMKIFGKKKKRK
ncbi:hypothetical protein [Tenacibaculum soleae]|uniref:hypothetical protein n=1 Tax=Tenacibaculum soleae TaxID=447689 RepID=UPI0026E48E26|nr:hypothetical protein [Tenacibaculum soleae]MDO6813788.1 hypothetical protein [Tenacibaculum soleae]